MGWKLIEENASEKTKSSCNFIWVDTSNVNEFFNTIQPWQRINHFPGMTNIARKTKLAEHLDCMKKRFKKDFSFYPTTYTLPRDKHHMKKYFEPGGKSKSTYIVKPDGGCQGRGIFLTKKWSAIEELSTTHVAQRYISDPLLIDNKKFDLRIYVLITSCDPLRIYLFQDGLVRLCTQDFSKPTSSNMENTCMHLSNYSINKRSEDFNGTEDVTGSSGSKRSVKWFLQWLGDEKGHEEAEKLWCKIGHICVKTMLSIEPILVREYNTTFCLNPQSTQNESMEQNDGGKISDSAEKAELDQSKVKDNFPAANVEDQLKNKCVKNISGSRALAVLGFDVMVDAKLKPHLIEVNHLPSFATDSPLDESIKSKVVLQALSVVQAAASDRHSYETDARKKRQSRLFNPSHKVNVAGSMKERRIFKPLVDHKQDHPEEKQSDPVKQKLDAVSNVEEFVTEIYSIHAPEKIDKVDALLRKYQGHEEWLIKKLKEKYCQNESSSDDTKRNSSKDEISEPTPKSTSVPTASSTQGEDCKHEGSDSGSDFSEEEEEEENEETLRSIDENLEFEDEILVQNGNYLRIYPPIKGKYKPPCYQKMRKHAAGEDMKRQMRLVCPLWQMRKYERHDEKIPAPEVIREVPKPIVPQNNGYCSRGDWMIHGNVHKKSEPIPTKTIPLPSQKQLEAAERLTRGFSVENAVLISEDEASKLECDDFVTRLSLAEQAGKEIRKKNEEKFIPRSQLNMNPINIAFGEMFQNPNTTSYSSLSGERCYVDFTGRKLGYR